MPDTGLSAWLRLTLVPGVGPETQRLLLAAFGLPEQIFASSRLSLRQVAGKKADLLLDTDNSETVAAALVWAAQPGNHIITLADSEFPRLLLEIPDPPSLLYVKGRPELLNRPTLAMVGSRNATPQGLQDAERFAGTLAAEGFTIASGLALGIDGAAHRGALAAGGDTVAVIGTGADRIYPSRHRDLALKIAENGAIVSEFPLGTPAVAHNFPRRNRLIAGLCRGCLVVEAALESGSLITARLAAEQGREVFAMPGSIHSPLAKGCHRLIKQGAKLVESAQDVLEELGIPAPSVANLPMPAITPTVDAAPEATTVDEIGDGAVLQALGHSPSTLDQLIERTSLTAEALYAILVALELADKIACLPGGRYQRLTVT